MLLKEKEKTSIDMLKSEFSSYVKRLFNDKRVVIVTHYTDEFGERKICENIITIDKAKEVLKNLEQTIKEYGGATL